MICEKCGLEFEVNDELKKLIATKAVAQVCDNCATVAPLSPFGHRIAVSGKRTKISILQRVDRLNAEGVVTQWISRLPRYPVEKRYRPKRPGRRDDQVEAFVMSFGGGDVSNKPVMSIVSNFDSFQRRGRPFCVRKLPGFQNSLTGQDKIEVGVGDIDRIEDDGSLEINIHLKDGGKIRLKFRN